jgi:hypothetical protein
VNVATVIPLVKRCASCDRVWTTDDWRATLDQPDAPETATVCPDCSETLAVTGLSAG